MINKGFCMRILPVAKGLPLFLLAMLVLLTISCASQPKTPDGLLSFDAAMLSTKSEIEANVPRGTEIAITTISTPMESISLFLTDELSDKLGSNRQFQILARGKDLEKLGDESMFQMSGFVSDDSAVSIGQYLGAKVIIIGSFSQFANFSQLRIRAIDVETAVVLATYSPRIDNNDVILAGITKPLGNTAAAIDDIALGHLNRGKDYFAESNDEKAMEEFSKAISINPNLSEPYFFRGVLYFRTNYDVQNALADLNEAIRLNPNYARAYNSRATIAGMLARMLGELDIMFETIIADYDKAISIDPAAVNQYRNRGYVYWLQEDYRHAIEDFNTAIRLDPNDAEAYNMRGLALRDIGNVNGALSDFDTAIALNSAESHFFTNRGNLYLLQLKNYIRAIDDFNQSVALNPPNQNNYDALEGLFFAYMFSNETNKGLIIMDILMQLGWEPPEWMQ
jgi:tetratricopeptide (TPR) repeat protein